MIGTAISMPSASGHVLSVDYYFGERKGDGDGDGDGDVILSPANRIKVPQSSLGSESLEGPIVGIQVLLEYHGYHQQPTRYLPIPSTLF